MPGSIRLLEEVLDEESFGILIHAIAKQPEERAWRRQLLPLHSEHVSP